MFFGVSTLQSFHVAISFIAIAAGFAVLFGMFSARRLDLLTAVFLATTLVTTLTGFVFPFNGFTPAFGVGIVSTLVLAVAIVARYLRQLKGPWRGIYVATAVLAFYLNVFVLVVQLFQKQPALHAFAPTGSEPPFAIAQAIVLLLFAVAGILAYRSFHPAAATG